MSSQLPLPTFLMTEAITGLPVSPDVPSQLITSFSSLVTSHNGAVLPLHRGIATAVFERAEDALATVLALHRAWSATSLFRLRSALHTGPSGLVNGIYFGGTLNRTRQLLTAALPDQMLLSATFAALVAHQLPPSVTLHDYGPQRLKDLLPPEPLWLLQASDLSTNPQLPRTLVTYPTNLPVQPTPFLGRTREVGAVQHRITHEQQRMLTLVAPSGHGKTRFALEVATRLLDAFPHGVFFISLAPIEDPQLVIPTIAQTLGLRESNNASVLEQVQQYLRERQVLLVIDNIEQVVAAAPELAALVAATHHLTLLITSHVPLQLANEVVVPVLPLDLPDLSFLPPIEQLLDYTAVALFLERIQAVHPHFAFDQQTAPLVVQICAAVGSIPLAIELVAAYGDMLSLAQLMEQLQAQGAGKKPLALPQVLDWSYAQLPPATQIVFARLGVFVEGCTFEAAKAICTLSDAEPIDVVDEIATLLQRNLLLEEELDGGDPRYIMLDCILDYAKATLRTRGEEEIIRRLHSAYYRDTAKTLGELVDGPQQGIWIRWVAGEQNNLRAAFQRAVERQDGEAAIVLCARLWYFWFIRGALRESFQWVQAALSLETEAIRQTTNPTLLRALSLVYSGASSLAAYTGQFEQAITQGSQSIVFARAAGDMTQVTYMLHNLGNFATMHGDYTRAKAWFHESSKLQQSLPMGPLSLTAANLGLIALNEGDNAAARSYLDQALALVRAKGEARETAIVLDFQGIFYLAQGELDAARANFQEVIRLTRQMGGFAYLSETLEGLAWIACQRQDTMSAARLLGAAEAQREALDQQRNNLGSKLNYADLVQRVQDQLDPPTFTTAWIEGRAMSFEALLALGESVR